MAFPSDLVRTKNWGSEVLTDSDLEGQLDLIINWAMALSNSTSGHTHDGTSNQGPKIPITNLTVASQALGDMIYSSSGSAMLRLAGNITTTKKFLTQTGDGAVSTSPGWNVLVIGDMPAGTLVQMVDYRTGARATGTTVLPFDDTIPQNTEGDEYMTLSITPLSATNKLLIQAKLMVSHSTASNYIGMALFQDTTANALSATGHQLSASADTPQELTLSWYMTSGTTSSTTFKIRAGCQAAGTTSTNNLSSARLFGGVASSYITITEVKA